MSSCIVISEKGLIQQTGCSCGIEPVPSLMTTLLIIEIEEVDALCALGNVAHPAGEGLCPEQLQTA